MSPLPRSPVSWIALLVAVALPSTFAGCVVNPVPTPESAGAKAATDGENLDNAGAKDTAQPPAADTASADVAGPPDAKSDASGADTTADLGTDAPADAAQDSTATGNVDAVMVELSLPGN